MCPLSVHVVLCIVVNHCMKRCVSIIHVYRHVESVRQCLEKCVGVFGLHSNRVGVATDSLPFLRTICSDQLQRQMNKTKRR